MELHHLIVRHRAPILLAWVAAAVLLLPRAGSLAAKLQAELDVRGSESARVDSLLARDFDSPFARYAILVVQSVRPDQPEGRQVLARLTEAVRSVDGVTRTLSWLDAHDPLFVGQPAGTFVMVGLDPGYEPEEELVRGLRKATESLVEPGGELEGVTARWTGPPPVAVDVRRASEADARASELRSLPFSLLLLLLAFGTVVASVLPLLVGVLAIALALGVSALLADAWTLSIMLQSVISLLGMALGIDYALLMVSRFRESLADGEDPGTAAAAAGRQAGGTILLSGVPVMIGFAGLLLVRVPELRSAAVGGLVVVLMAMLLATTLLPGVLSWLGRRIDKGRVRSIDPSKSGRRGSRWRAWGWFVVRRPVLVVVATAVPLLLLAWPARRLDPSVPANWLPSTLEAAQAADDLADMGRGGIVQTLRLVLELPEGADALGPDGWEATRRVTDVVRQDERIAMVRSLPALAAERGASRTLVAMLLPDSVRRTLVSRDGRAALIEAVPREGVGMRELSTMVRDLRGEDAGAISELPGARLAVGGLTALEVDYVSAVTRALPWVAALVLGGTFMALLVGFRSVIVPLKAIVLNLVSVAAAFGGLVLVFQDGFGAQLFRLDGPLEGVFPSTAILVFCVVFGLSMDYEVFLVSRVREARLNGASEAEAIVEGVARTGGVITSAAAIMVVIFVAFAMGQFLPAKLLGFALALAVALDAGVVRTTVGPGLLRLAGRWNWWPGFVAPRDGSESEVIDSGTRPDPADPGVGRKDAADG